MNGSLAAALVVALLALGGAPRPGPVAHNPDRDGADGAAAVTRLSPKAATPGLASAASLVAKKTRVVLDSGDTLSGALVEAGIPLAEALAASKAVASIADPRTLNAGQEIVLGLAAGDGEAAGLHLKSLALKTDGHRRLLVRRQPEGGFDADALSIDHVREVVLASGEIHTSLYKSARSRGVPAGVLLEAHAVLAYALDFQRDVRIGDAFSLGYEMFDDGAEGGRHPGRLVYASLTLAGRSIGAYRYTTRDGYTGFFDADGRSVETSLKRTPVDGARLSSNFGRRKHPILGYTRMHKGLDFAAPRGTPVLAAGDGVVARRGRYGGLGKHVRLRHGGAYATVYAHLSRFAAGLKPGSRVRQGEVIGFVGSSGLANGPNLHYEVIKNGVQVNPMTLKLPPRRVLTDELESFRRARAELLSALNVAADRHAQLSAS